MAIGAFIQNTFEAAEYDANAGDFMLRFAYLLFDSDTNQQQQESIRVVVTASDTAAQIEVKLRDAVIARASELGWTASSANVFQPALRRG